MNTDNAAKPEDPTNIGNSQDNEAGRSVGTATSPSRAVSGSKNKSSVCGIKRRSSRSAGTDGKHLPLEDPQPPLPIGREKASAAACDEGSSLLAETATELFGSTEGFNLKQKLAEVRRRISYI